MSDHLQIKISRGHGGIFQGITFSETREQYDQEPNVRLYCTMRHQAYALQIRARVPLSAKGGRKHERNLIATANLKWEHLVQIAEYVAQVKKEMTALVTDQEDYQIYPAEVIRHGLESNASEFSSADRHTLASILVQVEVGNLDAAREMIDKASETVQFYTIKPDDK